MMAALGVVVRPFAGLTGIGDTLRVTIGPRVAMEHTAAAILESPAPGGSR